MPSQDYPPSIIMILTCSLDFFATAPSNFGVSVCFHQIERRTDMLCYCTWIMFLVYI